MPSPGFEPESLPYFPFGRKGSMIVQATPQGHYMHDAAYSFKKFWIIY